MPISVFCEQCGKAYRVKDEQAGMRVQCPGGHILTVPHSDPAGQSRVVKDDNMAPGFEDHNPYGSPKYDSAGSHLPRASAQGKVSPPAILLIVVGGLGVCFSLLSVVMALAGEPPQVDPKAPEFMREFQQGAVGPLAAFIAALFVLVNAVIIVGAIQMLRFKSWALGLAASILAMLNLGSCCCILGLPIGIWSLVILTQQDVRAAFAQASGDGW